MKKQEDINIIMRKGNEQQEMHYTLSICLKYGMKLKARFKMKCLNSSVSVIMTQSQIAVLLKLKEKD